MITSEAGRAVCAAALHYLRGDFDLADHLAPDITPAAATLAVATLAMHTADGDPAEAVAKLRVLIERADEIDDITHPIGARRRRPRPPHSPRQLADQLALFEAAR